MNHLSHLRSQAATLAAQFDVASRDNNEDLMGTIAFRQMALDDQIERLERKLRREAARQFFKQAA